MPELPEVEAWVRELAPGAKGPKAPAFRLRFADGAELVLTEAGKRKRAGVRLLAPEAVEAELAHLGPDALEVDAAAPAAILGREARQLHPLLRDQHALAGIGRAHANEIFHRRLGEPCPDCATPIARVDYEEHTVFYCPACQTGGKVLKDRRLSRLLR